MTDQDLDNVQVVVQHSLVKSGQTWLGTKRFVILCFDFTPEHFTDGKWPILHA